MKTLTNSLLLKVVLAAVLAFGTLFIYTHSVDAQNLRPTDRTTTEQADRSDNGDRDKDGYGGTATSDDPDFNDMDSDEEEIDDGDGVPTATERANYNNSSSNRANVVDLDTDGDTDADGRADVRRQTDPDDDGDGVPTATDRANYNNSRSNRANIRSDFPGGDVAEERIRQLRGIDKSTPLLYQNIRASGSLCPINDCDDEDGDTRPDARDRRQHALRVAVSGDEVRGASEEAKAEVRQRLQGINEINNANDFGIRVALAALDNEKISDIETDDEQTTIRFRSRARIFGFIPAELRARVEATADGERVRYPWYAFLANKDDASSLRELAAEIRADHDRLFFATVEGEE